MQYQGGHSMPQVYLVSMEETGHELLESVCRCLICGEVYATYNLS